MRQISEMCAAYIREEDAKTHNNNRLCVVFPQFEFKLRTALFTQTRSGRSESSTRNRIYLRFVFTFTQVACKGTTAST
eukprot:COSAG06_NODE_3325_length_5502_cov_15.729513_1_plen_78_part_00